MKIEEFKQLLNKPNVVNSKNEVLNFNPQKGKTMVNGIYIPNEQKPDVQLKCTISYNADMVIMPYFARLTEFHSKIPSDIIKFGVKSVKEKVSYKVFLDRQFKTGDLICVNKIYGFYIGQKIDRPVFEDVFGNIVNIKETEIVAEAMYKDFLKTLPSDLEETKKIAIAILELSDRNGTQKSNGFYHAIRVREHITPSKIQLNLELDGYNPKDPITKIANKYYNQYGSAI